MLQWYQIFCCVQAMERRVEELRSLPLTAPDNAAAAAPPMEAAPATQYVDLVAEARELAERVRVDRQGLHWCAMLELLRMQDFAQETCATRRV